MKRRWYFIIPILIFVLIYIGLMINHARAGHLTVFPFYAKYTYNDNMFGGVYMTCYDYSPESFCTETEAYPPGASVQIKSRMCTVSCVGLPIYATGF